MTLSNDGDENTTGRSEEAEVRLRENERASPPPSAEGPAVNTEAAAPSAAPVEPPPGPTPPPAAAQPKAVDIVVSTRFPVDAVKAIDALANLHFTLGHIPVPARSEYIRYLVTTDAEKQRDDIKRRRAVVAGG